jgi:MFS family permease
MLKSAADPVGTLTVGNVISASVTLYKSNFKRYFQVSLRATAWAVAMVLVWTFIGGILYRVTNSVLVAIPLVLIGIGVTLFCLARYSTDRAVIARLAYQELIDRPESISTATQALIPRSWGFLRLAWLLGLYIFLVAFIGYILLAIGIGVCVGIIGAFKLTSNPVALGLGVIVSIGLVLLFIFTIVRYYAYWFIAELPLAMESTNSASFSMRRSKDLSRNMVRRVQVIIAIAILITLPISAIGNAPSLIGQFMATPALSPDKATQSMGNLLMWGGFFVGMASELIVVPFWQAIKAVVYYDLRNRREGSDLVI